MSKFCPRCGSEFQNKIEKCPTDNVKLKAQKPNLEALELLDVYAAKDRLEADYLAGTFQENNIDAQLNQSTISQFRTFEDTHHIVSINPKSLKKAKEMIKTARENELISDLGAYLA